MELLPLLLIFAVMLIPLWWMSSRQRKMQQKQQELVNALGVGDEVRTHSGFYGLIVEEYDDVVILESENGAQTKWARQAIAMKADPVGEEAAEMLGDESDEAGSDDDTSDGSIPGVTTRDDDPRDDDQRDR